MREYFEEQIFDLQDVLSTFTGNFVVINNDCISFTHQTFSKCLNKTAPGDFKSLLPLSNYKTHHEIATACLRCLILDDEGRHSTLLGNKDQLPWPNLHLLANQLDSTGMTALHYALVNTALRSIRFLKEQNRDAKATVHQGRSWLHFAIYSGNLTLIDIFITRPSAHPSLLNLAIERRNWK